MPNQKANQRHDQHVCESPNSTDWQYFFESVCTQRKTSKKREEYQRMRRMRELWRGFPAVFKWQISMALKHCLKAHNLWLHLYSLRIFLLLFTLCLLTMGIATAPVRGQQYMWLQGQNRKYIYSFRNAMNLGTTEDCITVTDKQNKIIIFNITDYKVFHLWLNAFILK